MVFLRYARRAALPLLGLFLLWTSSPLDTSAQTAPSCEREIQTAKEAYLNQEFRQVVTLLSDCLEQPGLPPKQAIRGYRLKSLSFFRQNSLVAARTAIERILSIDPEYRPDPVENPPSYALLVSMVRNLKDERTPPRPASNPSDAGSALSPAPPAPLDSVFAEDFPTFSDAEPSQAKNASPAKTEDSSTTSLAKTAPSTESLVTTYGLRLTHRNQGHELVKGLNLTLWKPRSATSNGQVNGIAVGVPATGAARLYGLGVGIFGVAGSDALHGIGLGGIGLTAGRLNGLAVGGLALHVDNHLNGIGVTPGLTVGSGSLRGLNLSGIGMGIDGSIAGLQVGGLGLRAGGSIGGLTLGTLGVSGGEDLLGLTASGAMLHAGDLLWGIGVTGGPIVASRTQGLALGSVVVQGSGTGLVVAPLYTHTGPDGALTGLSLSTFNHVRGKQRGLTIGLFNYASELQGVQLGLFNYAGNNPRFLRFLPGLNLNF